MPDPVHQDGVAVQKGNARLYLPRAFATVAEVRATDLSGSVTILVNATDATYKKDNSSVLPDDGDDVIIDAAGNHWLKHELQGLTGPEGPPGDQGEQGDQGPQGPAGNIENATSDQIRHNNSESPTQTVSFWLEWLITRVNLLLSRTVSTLAFDSDSPSRFLTEATAAVIRAATTGLHFITAAGIETASASVALTDAAPVAVDWDLGIHFTLTVTASRQIGNPTNGQPGTYRTILVQGNSSTDRTITFGSQFLGDLPTITDCDSTKWYLLTIRCITTSHFCVVSMVANKP